MVNIGNFSVATIPFIVISVYVIIELLKRCAFPNNEKFRKLIPIVAAVLGIGISLLTFFTAPELLPITNWYDAALMGVASGLSAVGINQLGKQLIKGGEDNDS